MNSRIVEIRKSENLTQDEFAKRIGLSRNYIWMIEKGERTPADRTIADICREFEINEHWLRSGVGNMKSETTQRDKIARFLSDVLASAPDDRSAFITALADLPPEFWPLVVDLAKNIVANINKEED